MRPKATSDDSADEPGCGVALSIGAAGSTRVFTESYRVKIGSVLIGMAQRIEQELGAPDPVDYTGLETCSSTGPSRR